jgi:pyridoxine 5-phosphate synthase
LVKLGVNIDHVATLRQVRQATEPDPIYAAILAELGGADGITVHLREDKRHIQDRDLFLLKEVIKTRLNLEMACSKDIVDIALKAKPYMCTLVPEKRTELTTEGGLDVKVNLNSIKETIQLLSKEGIMVSLFIDADREQIELAKDAGANIIEIHTGRYADKRGIEQKEEFEKIVKMADLAHKLNLLVSAGHGLNYYNIFDILKVKDLFEVNIGHSIIARSVYVGLTNAVCEMKNILSSLK